MIQVLAGIYLLGVTVALLTMDERGFARIGLALLWPLGPLAFIVTITILLAASLMAFPTVGLIVLAAALVTAVVWAIGL